MFNIQDELANENTPFPPVTSGRFYTSPNISVLSTRIVQPNVLYAIPIIISKTSSAVTLNIELTVGSTGNLARMGIYLDDNGKPGALVVDGGQVSTTGAGVKTVSISVTLNGGWYWLAIVCNSNPTVRGNSQATSYPMLGSPTALDVISYVGWSSSFALGATGSALPDPFQGGGVLASGTMPRVLLGI